MYSAIELLPPHHLWVIHPGVRAYAIDQRITAWPIARIAELPRAMRETGGLVPGAVAQAATTRRRRRGGQKR
jgi:hypothetical protein